MDAKYHAWACLQPAKVRSFSPSSNANATSTSAQHRSSTDVVRMTHSGVPVPSVITHRAATKGSDSASSSYSASSPVVARLRPPCDPRARVPPARSRPRGAPWERERLVGHVRMPGRLPEARPEPSIAILARSVAHRVPGGQQPAAPRAHTAGWWPRRRRPRSPLLAPGFWSTDADGSRIGDSRHAQRGVAVQGERDVTRDAGHRTKWSDTSRGGSRLVSHHGGGRQGRWGGSCPYGRQQRRMTGGAEDTVAESDA